MYFTRNGNMVAAAERVVPTFHAGCLHVRAYIIPASMYASQIWGTRYMKEGAEMDCPLQTGPAAILLVQGSDKYDREEGHSTVL
eukprot:1151703-Pelagomonas_calceolata.AAC.1